MVSKKVIIGIIAVVAVVVIVAAAFAGSSSAPADGRYDYKVELADSFTSSTGYVEHPGAGMQYAILTYKVINDHASNISTNPLTWDWTLKAKNLSYSMNFDTYSHPGYKLVDVNEGGEATQVIVFEVPQDVTISDISMEWKYFLGPKLERDTSITI